MTTKMNKNIEIRKAEYTDLESIYQFICELENQQFNHETFKLIFNKNIHNPEFAYLVAIIDYNIVGFISFHTQQLLHHCGRVGEIQELYVIKEYRNKGIGKKLIYEVGKMFNCKSVEVTSNRDRVENIKVYERLGFILSHNKFTK